MTTGTAALYIITGLALLSGTLCTLLAHEVHVNKHLRAQVAAATRRYLDLTRPDHTCAHCARPHQPDSPFCRFHQPPGGTPC